MILCSLAHWIMKQSCCNVSTCNNSYFISFSLVINHNNNIYYQIKQKELSIIIINIFVPPDVSSVIKYILSMIMLSQVYLNVF